MEQRRKIVVPTGTEADETLSTPHFVDDEATLLARPVVPLTEPVEPPPDVYADSRAAAAYAPRAVATASPWKRSTLILIILAAVGVGIASGLAIGLYQSRQKAPAAPVAAQPVISEPQQQAATQTEPVQSVRASQPEEQESEPEQEAGVRAEPADEETPDRETKNNSADKTRSDDKQSARDNRKRDEERVPPTDVPDNSPADYSVDDEREERIERRERRREERREARRAERRRQREEEGDAPLSVPRNVERARQEINRIRDIFEGRQP